MVNPGAFQGSRKIFLLSQKDEYRAGVVGGYAADALAQIQRKYLKRYPIDLPHNEEPKPEWLAAVDDEAPDEEQVEPDVDVLDEEELAAAVERLEERRTLLKFRKAQIKRWLAYQHMKDQDIDPTESGAQNPYRVLLHKLTGTTIHKPRKIYVVNVWRKTQRQEIDHEAKIITERENTPRSKLAAVRDKVARDLFEKLPQVEKDQWVEQANEEHEAAMAKWKEETEGSISTTPADRQRCIQGLVRFAQPILDLVSEATGWKCSMIAGGPEPAHGGRLNMISIHSGTTTGDIKMNFGRAERPRYRKYIVPIYGQFLQKCYSVEECRARTLPAIEGFESLETMDLDVEGATFDSFDFSKPAQPIFSALPHATAEEELDDADMVSEVQHHRTSPPHSAASQGTASPPLSPLCSPASSLATSPRPLSSRFRHVTPLRSQSPVGNVRGGASDTRPSVPTPSSSPNEIPHPLPTGTRKRKSDGAPERKSKRLKAVTTTRNNNQTLTRRSSSPTALLALRMRSSGSRGMASTVIPAAITHTAEVAIRARHNLVKPPTTLSKASTASSPSKISASDGAPSWFSSTLAMLQSSEMPVRNRWIELLELWKNFEEKEGYQENGFLRGTSRPKCIGMWISVGRSTTWRPALPKISAFEKEFRHWWISLQPDWRISEEGTIISEGLEGDWSKLRKPGLNGIQGALAALFYWGLEVKGNTKQHKAWAVHIDDCILVLRQLV